MKKRKRNKNKPCHAGINPELQEVITLASQAIAKAKSELKEVLNRALLPIAEEMNYANPKDVLPIMIEELEQELIDDTPEDWEKQLCYYARNQFNEWERERLNAEISKLESERSKL